MHELVLIRHAKSDWSTGEPDFERPLNARGLIDAPAAGAWLKANVPAPDLVVVSSAMRTQLTWSAIAPSWGISAEIVSSRQVYEASWRRLLRIIEGLAEHIDRAALIGHNPGISDVFAELTGEDVEFKTSSIAVLTIDAPWAAAEGHGSVKHFVTPRG